MKLNLGPASVHKIMKEDVICALLYDTQGKTVTVKVCPGMPIAGFEDVLREVARRNVDIEVDTSGFVFYPLWEKWNEPHRGIFLHRVRFTKQPPQ